MRPSSRMAQCGCLAALALVLGVILLITGFAREQRGHTVQFPINAVLRERQPEFANLEAAGPWQVYGRIEARPRDAALAEKRPAPVYLPISLLNELGLPPLAALNADWEHFQSRRIGTGESAFSSPRAAGEPAEVLLAYADFTTVDLLCLLPPRLSKKAAVQAAVAPPAAFLTQRADKYLDIVEQNAKRYGLSTNLVLAIIHTESSFNPQVVSRANALGLMQVVPESAGGEVHAYLNGQPGIPSTASLFNPETNIRYGTTYLHLLRTRHLVGIENEESRLLCIIAAYNGGPTAVYRAFGGERQAAIDAINSLTVAEVRQRLLAELPYRETREYVVKVLASLEKFSSLR